MRKVPVRLAGERVRGHMNTDSLALVASGRKGEPCVRVWPLDDGRNTEAPGRPRRLEAREGARVDNVGATA
jgi:hypothetical protein